MKKRFHPPLNSALYSALSLLAFTTVLTTAGCATSAKENGDKGTELTAAREKITKLEDKVVELETRLTALNDKINLEEDAKPSSLKSKAPLSAELPTEKIQPAAASNAIIPASKPLAKAPSKFAESFQQDEGTDRYREAKILLDSKRPADAILEFSEFIKDHPRHTLAPNAQYFIGAAYLQQKEYKLAEEELSRVLINYPHSNAIPDTLAALVKVSELLHKPARVTYFKEKLTGHFAHSPQAKSVASISSLPSHKAEGSTEENAPEKSNDSHSEKRTEKLDSPAPKETVKTIAERTAAIKKPQSPEPPTAPVPEMSAEDSHGFEPSVVKDGAHE